MHSPRPLRVCAVILIAFVVCGQENDCQIRTIAGSPTTAAGDGGPAANAQLLNASGLARDAEGSLYIADTSNHRIRKIAAGIITTIAGDGTPVDSGDDGPATGARVNYPTSIALGPDGSIYVASCAFIRKIRTDGIIVRVAGTSEIGFSEDGTLVPEAKLYCVSRIAVDRQDRLYFYESSSPQPGNYRIRMIDPQSSRIRTVAGGASTGELTDGALATEAADLDVTAMTILSDDSLAFVERHRGRVYRIDREGRLRALAGSPFSSDLPRDGAPSEQAYFGQATALAAENSGTLYIGDVRVWIVRPGEALRSFVSPGVVRAILPDADGVVVLAGSSRLLRLGASEPPQVLAGEEYTAYRGDDGPGTDARLSVAGLSLDREQAVLVADPLNNRIRRILPDGSIRTFAGGGSLTSDGTTAADFKLTQPNDVVVDRSGNAFIADTIAARLRRISPEGIVTTVAGNGMPFYRSEFDYNLSAPTSSVIGLPRYLALDAAGGVVFPDTTNSRPSYRLFRFLNGFLPIVSSGNQVNGMRNLVYDADGWLLFRRGSVSNEVLGFRPGGVETVFNLPFFARTFTRAPDGTYYFSDIRDALIKLRPGESPQLVVPGKWRQIPGDNNDGIASEKSVPGVNTMVVSAAGTLYVADADAGRVRMIENVGACRAEPLPQ